MTRQQELLDKLMDRLDLEFVDAAGKEFEDGWYVWRPEPDSDGLSIYEYKIYEVVDSELQEPMLDHKIFCYVLESCKPYGQLAGPILGR